MVVDIQVNEATNFNLTDIVTPVNADALDCLLTEANYDVSKRKFLVDGFKNGFPIGYEGEEDVKQTAPNLKLNVGNETELWNKMIAEVKAGRYAGPFKEIPFVNYIQSPVGLVPKDGGKATRLIFHLSYPRLNKQFKPKSLNGNTPREKCTVKYTDFDQAILRCLEEGAGCYLGKSDMKSAFRHFGIRKKDWRWLVMMARHPVTKEKFYFVDKCMPFGAAISCSHFQTFSDAVALIFKHRTGKRSVNYLDDFLFIALLKLVCNNQIQEFLRICDVIRFPVSMDKTFWGTTSLTFLGILIDTVKQMVFVPLEKIDKARIIIRQILSNTNKKVTVKELQKLCGLLNFFSRCIIPARTFTRRLYSKYSGHSLKPHYHIRVDREMRLDLTIWEQFLHQPEAYCRPFTDFLSTFTAEDINLYTDSSGSLGCGGFCDSAWFSQKWDESFLLKHRPSIEYLELYAVTVAVMLWIHKFQNRKVALFCDNMSVVHMLNNTTSSCKNCMILIRIIVLLSLKYNVRVSAKHVTTKANKISDLLSRLKISSFRKLTGNTFDDVRTEIPDALWPLDKVWF